MSLIRSHFGSRWRASLFAVGVLRAEGHPLQRVRDGSCITTRSFGRCWPRGSPGLRGGAVPDTGDLLSLLFPGREVVLSTDASHFLEALLAGASGHARLALRLEDTGSSGGLGDAHRHILVRLS